MNCDNCKHYCWYYDKCLKWNCEVDAKEIHNCFEPNDTYKKIMYNIKENWADFKFAR